MKPLSKMALILALGISLTGLAACGGGGKKDDDKDDQAQNGFPADFQLFQQDGIWKITTDIDFSHSLTVNTGGNTVTGSASGTAFYVTQLSVDYADDSHIRFTHCDEDMPDDFSLQDLEQDLYFQDTDTDDLVCTNERHTYTRINDDTYTIEIACDNAFSAVITAIRVSDGTGFNAGTFSFNGPETYPSLNADSGVCGELGGAHGTAVFPDGSGIPDQSFETFEIVAAARSYGQDPNVHPVALEMEFTVTPEVGAYTVVAGGMDPGPDEVGYVQLTSAVFGQTAEDPASILATGGTVTITAITDSAVSGTFDLQTDQGNFSGSFDYDLNQ